MIAILRKLLSSRKLLLIGVPALGLCAATSAAAILIGKDRLVNLSYGTANGFACETAQSVNISKSGATWIRKYIRMGDAPGIERVKTALRVAAVVYAESQPDLIQISVLDENGPELRSNMRGRAIAAQIVFIADPASFPDDTSVQSLSAFYHDGAASSDGSYYGLRIDMPFEDVKELALAQDYFVDCSNPEGDAVQVKRRDASAPKALPTNLGQLVPKVTEPAETFPPDTDADDSHDGDLDLDLLTSTPVSEKPSYFSLAYWKALLFGKGANVAEAAVE